MGEIYNIGGNSEKKNIEVVELIYSILERKTENRALKANIRFIKDPRGVAHDFRYALDYSKIKKELGWNAQQKFEKGLEQTIQWYLENQEWVKKVISGEYQEYYRKVYKV